MLTKIYNVTGYDTNKNILDAQCPYLDRSWAETLG